MRVSTQTSTAVTLGQHRLELMDRMMEVSGVDLLRAIRPDGGESFVKARAKCRSCPFETECVRWLIAEEGRHEPPEFCLNYEFFQSCREN